MSTEAECDELRDEVAELKEQRTEIELEIYTLKKEREELEKHADLMGKLDLLLSRAEAKASSEGRFLWKSHRPLDERLEELLDLT